MIERQISHSTTSAPTPFSAAPEWQFVLLLAVTNWAVLRRRLGRADGERLIAATATRIAGLLPDARVAVVGGEVIEATFQAGEKASIDAAIDLVDLTFAEPVAFDGNEYRVELAIGAATAAAADDHKDIRLIEEAELALSEARRERHPVTRTLAGAEAGVDRVALARDLHEATDNDELFLVYQPKLHVRRQAVTSIEALMRWRHPVRGLVMPNDFIPLAEESHDIVTMTLWAIRRVIEDQLTLRARGHDVTIFINISGVLLADARFVHAACALVEGSDARIGFEITETSVIRDPASAIANLNIFAGIGIVIAIDDYGAGLSSLAYLKQLPARELKIDKLFVTQLTSSNRDPLIVRSTIDLAHALEMEVVAEGVETPASLALLTVMGCDMVQGYLISRPIELDALIRYLDEDRHLAATPDPRQMLSRIVATRRAG